MAKKKARGDEMEAAAAESVGNSSTATRKRTRTGGSSITWSAPPPPGSGIMCDDVLRSIFARVPARTAVASMALSKHHRLLIHCPDFRALHRRLAPPLPRPHVAYVATAKLRRSGGGGARGSDLVSGYHGFHIAGGGSNAPMRALAGPTYLGKSIRERDRDRERATWSGKELLVYDALGGAREQPRLRTLLSDRPVDLDGEISSESLYIDGTVYLLQLCRSAILAIDVDGETVTTIDLPGKCWPWRRRAMSTLLVVSGRPCVELEEDGDGRALWSVDAHDGAPMGDEDNKDGKLFMYCYETKKKMAERNLPTSKTPDRSDYALCWGYKPTLISPGSIVGEVVNQDDERRRDCTAEIMAALKPVDERHRRIGQEETLDTVCFMEFLLRIMRALPENMQDVNT
ncbi:unnamed protein product [Urochloa decumbens]|uniref:F-box protein n=1 Tax=Urochloa decumbens TaxID=240449 RepID=A0ABC8YMP3_9POAL